MQRMARRAVTRNTAGTFIGIVAAALLVASGAIALEASMPCTLAAMAPAHAQRNAAAGDSEQVQPVDINTADVERLMTIRGIGKSLAQRIIDYRKEHGPFKSVDDLLNVRGIGEKSLARFRDQVTVGSKG